MKRPTRDASTLGAAGAALSGTGAALVATAATACCAGPVLAPLVVAVLGAGGAAWAAGLKPYSPWLLGGAFVLLAFGFRSAYRRPESCATGPEPAARRRWPERLTRAALWLAALVWLAALAVNLLLDS